MQLIAYCKGCRWRLLLTRQNFLAMKMLTLILFIACLAASANGLAQNITISLKNAPLEKVFKEIERQSHYRFVYTREQLAQTHPITLNIKATDIENLLRFCFKDQPISYVVEKKYILIKSVTEEKKSINVNQEVVGKVLNENGEPQPGASVTVIRTGQVFITGTTGEFSLTDVGPNDVIIISATEMETEQVTIGIQVNIRIVLKQKIGKLDETIVIGYGTTTRRYSTGSITKIAANDISKQPVANPLQALQGRVPGLLIRSTSGIPGASFNVQIRGQNSLNPNPSLNAGIPPLDNPLFIIDGVPFAPQNNNINQSASLASPGNSSVYANPYAGMSPFSSINPADIESIEVLRDADATAIYGSRAANGVIIITTKKGQVGKTKFNLSVYRGNNKATRTKKLLTTSEYLQLRREGFANDGIVPTVINAPDLTVFDTFAYTDWKNYFIGGVSSSTDVNAQLSGGNASTNFLLGAGYRHDTYIFPGDFGNNRGSLNFNVRHTSQDKSLVIELSANYSYNQNTSSGSPSVLLAYTLPPNYPSLTDASGNLNWTYNGVALKNPLGYLKQKYVSENYNLISHLQLEYKILPGLYFRSSFGYNQFTGNENSQNPRSSFDPATVISSSSIFGVNNFMTFIIEPQVEYRKVAGKMTMNILLGGTYQKNNNNGNLITGTNYSNDNLLGSISAAGSKIVTDAFSEKKYIAGFSRVNFVFSKKYILNLSARVDGSSRFGPGKQFGQFGAAGAGWIFSDEKLFKKIKILSYGKLRVSYGTTGSDNITDYLYLSRWAPNSVSYQGIPGYTPQNLFNENLQWSTTKKMEAGIDLGFFSNKLLTSAVVYRHRSTDQLVTYRLPSQTGFNGISSNFPALVQNTGVEIQVSGTIIKKTKFNWTTAINITIPKNKLVSFPGIESSSYYNFYVVGKSLAILNKFKYLGLNSTTGIYEFDSPTGVTSNPSNNDRYIIGNLDPKFYGGFNNSISYKNFQFDCQFEFQKQIGANYLQQILGAFPPGTMNNQLAYTLNRWQKAGDNTAIQKLTSLTSGAIATAFTRFANSSGAYSDASYLRLSSLSASYSLPEKILAQLKCTGFKIYVNTQNLLTISKYLGNDPETRSFFSMPPLRSIVAGIQITL